MGAQKNKARKEEPKTKADCNNKLLAKLNLEDPALQQVSFLLLFFFFFSQMVATRRFLFSRRVLPLIVV